MQKYMILAIFVIVFFNKAAWIRGAEVNEKKYIITKSHFLENDAYMNILNQRFANFSEQSLLFPKNPIIDVQNNIFEVFEAVQEYNKEIVLPILKQNLLYMPSKKYSPGGSLQELCMRRILQITCKDIEKNEYDVEKLKAMKYWYVFPTKSKNDPEITDKNFFEIIGKNDPEKITIYTKAKKKFLYIPPDPKNGQYVGLEDFSAGELDFLFSYPDFPQSAKELMLEISFNVHKNANRHRLKVYNLLSCKTYHFLSNLASLPEINTELKEKITSYNEDERYTKKETYKLLIDIASKIESTKEKIISFLIEMDNYDVSSIKDYKTEIYDVLGEIVVLAEVKALKEEIERYLYKKDSLEYDKSTTLNLLNALVSLPKIDIRIKEKIYSSLVKLRFGGKFRPHDLLQESLKYCWNEKKEASYAFYNWVIDYSFQHYPLYTAKILTRLALTGQPQENEVALTLVKEHKLLQQAVDNDPYILQEVIRNENSFKLFLDYGVQFHDFLDMEKKYPNLDKKERFFVHDVVKHGNIKLLLQLKEQGVDFSDPMLIDTALKAKKFDSLSFVAAEQNKIPEIEVDLKNNKHCSYFGYEFNLKKEEVFREYYRQGHKALLHARATGDARPLEEFVLDMQKWHEIYQDIMQLDDGGSYEGICKNLITKLTTQKLSNPNVYPIFFKNVLEDIEKFRKSGNETALQSIERLHKQMKDFGGKMGASVYFSMLFSRVLLMQFREGSLDPDSTATRMFQFFDILGILGTIGFFDEYKKNNDISSKMSIQKQINYIEGLLRGRAGQNGKKIAIPQEENYDQTVMKRKAIFTILSCSVFNIPCSLILPFITEKFCSIFKKDGVESSSIDATTLLFFNLIVVAPYLSYLLGRWLQKDGERAKHSTEQLFERYFEQGKVKGFAAFNGELSLQEPAVQPGYLKIFFGAVKTYFAERWTNIKKIRIRASSNQA